MSNRNKPAGAARSLSSLPPCAGRLSRRDFCAAAGAGLATLGIVACGGGLGTGNDDLAGAGTEDLAGGNSTCPPGGLAGGSAAALATGTYQHLTGGGNSVYLCRDATGLFAMDARCTHEGALLTKQASRMYCPRHGATFDLNGEHPTGPANGPLDHYSVCVDAAGNISIDPNTVVDATTRV